MDSHITHWVSILLVNMLDAGFLVFDVCRFNVVCIMNYIWLDRVKEGWPPKYPCHTHASHAVSIMNSSTFLFWDYYLADTRNAVNLCVPNGAMHLDWCTPYRGRYIYALAKGFRPSNCIQHIHHQFRLLPTTSSIIVKSWVPCLVGYSARFWSSV